MIPRRMFGTVFAALTGLVVLAGPAAAHTGPEPGSLAERASLVAAPPTAPTAVDTGSIPDWIWIVVAVVGLLAVIVVGLRQLKGRGKDD